jgi:hypothetical protein
MTEVTAEEMAALCGLSSAAVASQTRRGVMQRRGKGKLKLELSTRSIAKPLLGNGKAFVERFAPGCFAFLNVPPPVFRTFRRKMFACSTPRFAPCSPS